MKGITPQGSQDWVFYLLSTSFHYFTLWLRHLYTFKCEGFSVLGDSSYSLFLFHFFIFRCYLIVYAAFADDNSLFSEPAGRDSKGELLFLTLSRRQLLIVGNFGQLDLLGVWSIFLKSLFSYEVSDFQFVGDL